MKTETDLQISAALYETTIGFERLVECWKESVESVYGTGALLEEILRKYQQKFPATFMGMRPSNVTEENWKEAARFLLVKFPKMNEEIKGLKVKPIQP